MAQSATVTADVRRPTWEMSLRDLARVVAEHRGYTRRTAAISDETGRPVAIGYDQLAEKMRAAGWIKAGAGINWRRVDTAPRLPRLTRDAFGYWR